LKSIALLIKTIRRGAKKVKDFTKRGLNIIAIENYKNWLIGIIPVSYRLSVEDAKNRFFFQKESMKKNKLFYRA
jgi:hypothetical protein